MTFIGGIFSIYILAVAAIETAVGLSIILAYYRVTDKNYNSTEVSGPYSEELLSALVLTLEIHNILF